MEIHIFMLPDTTIYRFANHVRIYSRTGVVIFHGIEKTI